MTLTGFSPQARNEGICPMTKATQDQREQLTLGVDEIFEIRRQHRANIPGKHHEAYRKSWDEAMRGKRLMVCIKAKCLDCMNWQATEVKRCTCVACPLYEVRPYVKHPQRAGKSKPGSRPPVMRHSAPGTPSTSGDLRL